MPRLNYSLLLVVLLSGTLACSLIDSDDEEDLGEPFITGPVTEIEMDNRRLLVEENPEINGALEDGGNKIWLSVDDQTEINFERIERLEECDFSCLQENMIVQAWVTGPVAESYPLQGTASRIEVIAE